LRTDFMVFTYPVFSLCPSGRSWSKSFGREKRF
jgi:hypothetical protein